MPLLYAETSLLRVRQVLADVGVVVWVVISVRLAAEVHERVAALGAPGRRVEAAGAALDRNMREAGRRIDGVPVVGDDVRAPFDRAGDAARAIAGAGRGAQEAAASLATVLAVVLLILAVLVVLVRWLPWRVSFVREATAARDVRDAGGDLDLLAVRALARRPLRELSALGAGIGGAWRRQDPAATRALAEAELRACGLRLSARTSSPRGRVPS